MNRIKPIAILFTIIIPFACDRMEYFPDRPLTVTKTHMLGHRAAGRYDDMIPLADCIRGLERMDGIEVDLQMSADNTAWLSHEALIVACGTFGPRCFISLADLSIAEVNQCLKPERNYIKLETLFAYVSENHADKYLSLDVKAWDPCEGRLNITRQMNDLARSIIHLTEKYHLQKRVMVESETGDFLYYIKKNSTGIETYLTTLGDFELGASRALSAGFSGISFQYKVKESITKDHVALLHRKGLKIQLWLVNEPADIEEAKAIGVDYIQTDLVD
jgi:glycerophosphoryl diester phosphodiesterase